MTRPGKKLDERGTLDRVLGALGLRPDEEPQAGEAPDFILQLSGQAVGFEVTMYRSGATVDDGAERRKVESEEDRLLAAADAFRKAHPELRDVNVGLMFVGPVPPRTQHAAFIEEVAGFIRARSDELQSKDALYRPPSFSAPLMRTYLRALYLRLDRFAVWYTNLAGGFVARPDHTIAAIVADKSGRRFRLVDQLWLAIQCSTRISETLFDILGVEDFAAVPSLEPFVFSRVLVVAFTGVYQWKRGEGWRKLTGEDRENRGPTLVERSGA